MVSIIETLIIETLIILCLCPLGLIVKLNFNLSKGAYFVVATMVGRSRSQFYFLQQ